MIGFFRRAGRDEATAPYDSEAGFAKPTSMTRNAAMRKQTLFYALILAATGNTRQVIKYENVKFF